MEVWEMSRGIAKVDLGDSIAHLANCVVDILALSIWTEHFGPRANAKKNAGVRMVFDKVHRMAERGRAPEDARNALVRHGRIVRV